MTLPNTKIRRPPALGLLFLLHALPVFQAQANVLLLAHFDEWRLNADYSAGGLTGGSAGSGARGGELGMFKGAADLGYRTPTAASFAMPAKGNLDSRQGTIEFFLKTSWDWSAVGIGDRGHPPFVQIPLESNGLISVYAYHHESGFVSLSFNLREDGGADHAISAGVSPVGRREVKEPWKKDEWHHIAVSWTPDKSAIFADGKLLVEQEWDPPLSLPPVPSQMWVGGTPGTASGVLIDELRIQDVPSDQVTVPTEPYPIPETIQAQDSKGPWTTIPCYHAAAAPTLDGMVGDQTWKEVPWVGGFHRIGSGTDYTEVPTRFAVCYDSEALFLAVVCEEPNLDGLHSKQVGEDVPVFGEDAIEFFIDPLRRHNPYYQIAFNTDGGRYDGEGMSAKWNGDWTVEIHKGDDQWTAELRLPFSALKDQPEPGQTWGINLARDRRAGGGVQMSTWSPLQAFHRASDYAGLRFEAPTVRPDPRDTATINRDYLHSSETLVANNSDLWQRQLHRTTLQLQDRSAPGQLTEDAARLAQEIENLGRTSADLAPLDMARVSMLAIGRSVEEVTARVHQLAPSGPTGMPKDLATGLTHRGDIWFFVTDRTVFAVKEDSGMVAGIWNRADGVRLVAASSDHYRLETLQTETEAEELEDKVIEVSESGGTLTLRCSNPFLPTVSLVKEYRLKPEGPRLSKRVTVTGEPGEKTILRITSRTYFDEQFRQDSYYQRLLHPAIMMDSVVKAREITAPLAQPGFMGQAPDGCSQFCASNLETGQGVGQFLVKVNGQFAYPPRSLSMSTWTSWGWEMSWLSCFLRPKPFSSEMDYMAYEGDHFTFHSRYLELPEPKKTFSSWKIPPVVSKTRYVTMPYVGWNHLTQATTLHPDLQTYIDIAKRLLRPDESILYLQQQYGDNWGDFPAADGRVARFREPGTGRAKMEIPAEKVRLGMKRFREAAGSAYLPGFYQFLLDVAPGTPPFEAGWYILDKTGKGIPGWYGVPYKGFLCDMSPGFIDYCARGIAETIDYHQTGFIYIDWPYLPCFADWKGEGHVIQTTDVMELFRRIHQECTSRGVPLMVNSGAGVPYTDVGIFEGTIPWKSNVANGYLEGRWRQLYSDPLMMMKLYEPPGFASHVWPWSYIWSDPEQDNTREHVNYALLFGMRTSAAGNSEFGDQLKTFTPPGGKPGWLANGRGIDMYSRAGMELAPSRIVDVELSHRWWREDTELEAYALRLGPAHVLTCLSHYTEPRPVTLSAGRNALALEPGKRTFVWKFPVRSPDTIVRQPDPPPAGWNVLCPDTTCRSFVQEETERIEVDLGKLPPLQVRLAAVTQVPAAIVSATGQDTQFALPHTLGCKVDGTLDEAPGTIKLQVRADKDVEVIAWWPADQGLAVVTVGDQEVTTPAYVEYGVEQFVRFPVPRGETTITIVGR